MTEPAVQGNVLLVEDDEGIRETIAECLAGEGHAVTVTANGAQALAWLDAGGLADLVLLDMIMPVMTGDELLRRLRLDARFASLPVVLMTAAPDGASLHGAQELLSKPFDLAVLLELVARYLPRPR